MNRKERIATFITTLGELGKGELASLKRDAGKPLAESRHIALFYRTLPYGTPKYEEEMFFLVATLYPLGKGGTLGNFGQSLRVAQELQSSKGLNRRVEILLDSDMAQLPFRLRQAVRLLYSMRVPIHWQSLLMDLLSWSREDRSVQRKWARSYFVGEAKKQ